MTATQTRDPITARTSTGNLLRLFDPPEETQEQVVAATQDLLRRLHVVFGENTFKAPYPGVARVFWRGLTVEAYDLANPDGPSYHAKLATNFRPQLSWEDSDTDPILLVRRLLKDVKDSFGELRATFKPLFRHAAR